jgi:hypothetical protein
MAPLCAAVNSPSRRAETMSLMLSMGKDEEDFAHSQSCHGSHYHGDFTADDPKWNAQARLKQKLTAFCEEQCVGLQVRRNSEPG